MKKIWLMAVTTYKQRIRSGSFLILTFVLPVLMVVVGAVSFLTSQSGEEIDSIGYIDETGQLAPVDQVVVEDTAITFRQYTDIESADSAWQQGEIDGYLVFPQEYLQGEQPTFYGEDNPGQAVELGMRKFARRALLPGSPDWLIDLLEDPSRRVYVALETGEQVSEGLGLIVRFATPAAISLLLGLALLFTSSQMGAVIVREKDQRSMEMVITSMSPSQLVTGKVLGMTLLVLTQFAIWGIGAVIGIGFALAGDFDPQNISLPWNAIIWALLLSVPGYFLYAVLAAGLGILAGDTQQAQQWAGFLGFFGLFPLWFAGLLIQAPNSPLAIGLTLFPLTGPIFALLRMALVEVPVWQLALSMAILVVSLLIGIWFVTRIFRAAMLMYGKSFRPKQILLALREA